MPAPLSFVVITGLSGAGKSYAIKCFEDMGFFCVDNLPTTLIPTFADLIMRSEQPIVRVALGVDVREGAYLSALLDTMRELRTRGHTVEVLFLEASEEALVRRYHETRRRHPLAGEGNALDGIRAERKALSDLREIADRILDPSALAVHYLTVAIGCTGGRHRSVTFAEELGRFLSGLGYAPTVVHRDLERE